MTRPGIPQIKFFPRGGKPVKSFARNPDLAGPFFVTDLNPHLPHSFQGIKTILGFQEIVVGTFAFG